MQLRALLFLVVSVVAGVSTAANAEPFKIVVGQKRVWDTAMIEFGIRAGLFKAEGLDVDMLFTNGGGEPLQAVLSGSVVMSVSSGLLGVMSMVAKGAPLKIISANFTGTSESYWYVRTDSPIKSVQDIEGKSIAFTGFGSSSQMQLMALLNQYGIKAKTVAAGDPTGIMTSVLSGQIDVGFSPAPLNLKAVEDGKVRIIAHGSDIVALKNQTVRVNVATADTLSQKRDLIQRFTRGLRATVEFVYSDPRPLEWFAEMHGLTFEQTRRARDEFLPRSAMQPGAPSNVELSIEQAKQFKYVPPNFTARDLAASLDLVDAR